MEPSRLSRSRVAYRYACNMYVRTTQRHVRYTYKYWWHPLVATQNGHLYVCLEYVKYVCLEYVKERQREGKRHTIYVYVYVYMYVYKYTLRIACNVMYIHYYLLSLFSSPSSPKWNVVKGLLLLLSLFSPNNQKLKQKTLSLSISILKQQKLHASAAAAPPPPPTANILPLPSRHLHRHRRRLLLLW